ncbi:MAG: recombinase family protein [Cyclobacteriaceae bacterium]
MTAFLEFYYPTNLKAAGAHEQNLNLQQDALKQAGCEKIITDTVSGAKAERPGLAKVKELLRGGDTLVVWRLDRLGRSLRDLIDWMHELEEQGIAFRSIQESINTSTSGGKLIFHMFGALAEFERNLIRERTLAGLAAARARGKQGGRPKSLSPEQRKSVVKLYHQQDIPVQQICQMFNISKPTLYKYVDAEQ